MISIDWKNHVILIPRAYLTLVGGTLYELNTDQFRLDLKALEADSFGIPNLVTHRHNTSVTVAGITYARTIEILPPYSITFENGLYTVRLVGSNNNIFDVENGILNQNYVQVIPTNAAGLITVTSGSGVTEQDKLDIADRVWDEDKEEHTTEGTFGEEEQSHATIDEVNAQVDTALADYAGATKTDLTTAQAEILDAIPTPTETAGAVWDEQKEGHTAEGTFGEEAQTHATPNEVLTQVAAALVSYAGATKTDLTNTENAVIDAVPTVGEIDTGLGNTHGTGNWGATGPSTSEITEAVWEGKTIPTTGEIATEVWSTPALVGTTLSTLDATYTESHINRGVASGRWKLVNNQLIIYDWDGETPLRIFNLFDAQGNPTMESVYERVPVVLP